MKPNLPDMTDLVLECIKLYTPRRTSALQKR